MDANYTVKESITQALIVLMQSRAYEDISVSDVVRKSGVCRASFYRNYRDKEDVLRKYLRFAMRNCPEYYDDVGDTADPFAVSLVCRAVKENRRLFDVLAHSGLTHLLHEQILDMVRGYIQRHALAFSAYEVAFLAHGALGILLAWIDGGYRESEEELTEIILRLLKI